MRNFPITLPMKAASTLINAWKECTITRELEETKREGIRAFRDVNVKSIEESSAILKLYLERTFQERAVVIRKMFDHLDKGLADGNMQLASDAMTAIVSVLKHSPLAEARKIISDIRDPNVKMIEI